MPELPVDVQAAIARVDRGGVDQIWCFAARGLTEQGFDGLFELTALFHSSPLFHHRFVVKQLDGGCTAHTSLFGDLLIGFDINHDRLCGTVELMNHPLQLRLQHMARATAW